MIISFIPIHNSLLALAQCWENPNIPFLLNGLVDVHTRSALPLGYAKNVYPKMLFGKPLTELEGE